MRVLIATDGSKEATAALKTAARLLRPDDRELDLLCVARAPRRLPPDRRRAYERRILSQSAQILTKACASLPPDSGVANMHSAIGSPSAVIVSKAEDYDLTVVGSKGRGTVGEVGLGPVASRVVEHALAPVLVARELRTEDGIRVLAAVDGSMASSHAVETLAELFDLRSAEVCLMHVAETPWIQLDLGEDWTTYSEEDKEHSETGLLEKELVREGETIVEQARDLLRGQRVAVTTRIDEGNPADEILSEADRGQYDLIVIGATGTRDMKHSMLGSASSKIAWNAPCSVLIVREPEQ